jgi:hypothetical protein
MSAAYEGAASCASPTVWMNSLGVGLKVAKREMNIGEIESWANWTGEGGRSAPLYREKRGIEGGTRHNDVHPDIRLLIEYGNVFVTRPGGVV